MLTVLRVLGYSVKCTILGYTCTVLVEPTYMYCTCVPHLHVYTQHTMSVCGPSCAIVRLLLQNKKWLLGASVSHAHSEALLRAMSTVSMVTTEVALVALRSKLEVKMSATKLPSCVTMKT